MNVKDEERFVVRGEVEGRWFVWDCPSCGERISSAVKPPEIAPEDGLKPFLEGFHLTDGNMDAMNAALSHTFPIYSHEEAGTDLEGDAVTILDTLRGNGYFVVNVDALLAGRHAPRLIEQAAAPDGLDVEDDR